MIRATLASALGCGLALTVALALLERRTLTRRARERWEALFV